MKVKRLSLILFLIINAFAAAGNGKEFKKLSLEQASRGRLLKPIPMVMGWKDDLHYYRYEKGEYSIVNAVSGKSRVLLDIESSKKLVAEGFRLALAADRDADFNKFLFVKEDTIYLFSRKENRLTPLLKTDGAPQNPSFSPDAAKIAYTLKGNLFVFDLNENKSVQLTRDGSAEILNGHASWVYYEEIMGRRSEYRAFWWNPAGDSIVFMRFDQSRVPLFLIYKADGDYGSLEQQRYPKPGYPNPTVKIGIVNLKSLQCQWLDIGEREKTDHYLAFPTWNQKGNKLYFQWMNRDQDHLQILAYDLETKNLQKVYEEHQKEWVEFFDEGDFFLLENNGVLIRSSKDGWYHIYYISKKGEERQLTGGNWSVDSIECVAEKAKRIFFIAGKEDSTESHLYKLDYWGKAIGKLTEFKGMHRVKVSPQGRFFIDEYSSLDTPTRCDLRDSRGKLVKKLGDSYSAELEEYRLAKGELFKIKTEDGLELPVIRYRPPDFAENKKYPVLIYIYGGPGSTMVKNRYLWLPEAFYLAQEGIICLLIDHRGSSHFGKKGATAMYRHLGKWEMHDYIEAVKYLGTLPYIDGKKIGINGHSYGGYLAALALTYGADYFQYGIAASSVMDWKLYDSIYTERYMDTPRDNPEGYKESSVLTYIDRFKGVLRVTHGTMDDNVHFQNTLQFIDKVLDTGKTVELMIYPGERHGIDGLKWGENHKSNLVFWLKHLLGRNPGEY